MKKEKQRKPFWKRILIIWMAFEMLFFSPAFLVTGTDMQEEVSAANMPEEEQEGQSGQLEDARQEVRLETTAQWVDPAAYRGEITLEATGIQRYTRNQMPVQVIPVLDMTDSMNSCESERHVFPLRAHAISVIPDYQKLWEQLKPQLPTWEEYTRMGQENPENLFLQLPEEVDPTGKARLFCCQRNGSDGYGQHALAGWKIIYVTDDQTPLWDISMEDYSWFYHCIRKGGIYQPIGEMEVKEQRTVWKKDDKKRAEYGCVCSRMDTVKEAYSQFVQAVFENESARICPVAFIGGYYMGGWQNSAQEALRFVTEETYLDSTLTAPGENVGTNLEAAIAGAMEGVQNAGTAENTYVLLFTDGSATSGYFHQADGSVDVSKLDTHSYQQPQWSADWNATFCQWAVEDAQALKALVPIYTVGYGYQMTYDDFTQEALREISSGDGYFIDTRQEEFRDILHVFQTIYQDMLQKATQVQVEDVISEYWQLDKEALPYGWQVEEIAIENQKGEADQVEKIAFPITKEMGEDDREEFIIPIILRESYRRVEEQTWYITNQDSPLQKDQEGAGARVTYKDLDGNWTMNQVASPQLDAFPPGADFSVMKVPLQEKVTGGEQVEYEIQVKNLGQCTLADIIVEDHFIDDVSKAVFEEQQGILVKEDDSGVMIEELARGANITLKVRAQTAPDQNGMMENVVTVTAQDPLKPEKYLKKESRAQVEVTPQKADFTVEKRANCTSARPGDTVEYEIEIVNKGGRTLHSVLTVDRFLQEGVRAYFHEQEGVTLNAEKTQAVVKEILPGEHCILKAAAVIPENFTWEELVNVAVVRAGDKEQETVQESTAEIVVKDKSPGASTVIPGNFQKELDNKTPTPSKGSANSSTKMQSQKTGSDRAKSPKTGDDTSLFWWITIAVLGMGDIAGILLLLKKKGT